MMGPVNRLSRFFIAIYLLCMLISMSKAITNGQLINLIGDAIANAEAEEALLEDRYNAGIDQLVPDFLTCDPLLLAESPVDSSYIEWQSRRINWIARLLKERNAGVPLEDVILHQQAIKSGIKCPFVHPTCPPNPYRSVDGSCNNVAHPLLGAANTPFIREMPATYESDLGRDDAPRVTAADGSSILPNARIISTLVHEAETTTNPESDLTFHFTMWGQFLAHDITDRAPGKGHEQAVIDCVDQSLPTPGYTCFNIDVPVGDFFRNYGRDQLNFPRSTEVTDLHCEEGTRQQLNTATSFIDGGSVYGASKEKLDYLRSYVGGELSQSEPDHLPYLSHPTPIVAKKGLAFMQAGDDRVTEFTGLTGIETVWPREHNRVAAQLATFNPSWDDETLFQETRRIIIAMIQHISYNEWLPAALGSTIMTEYDLDLLPIGAYHGYDATADPSVSNALVGAAFRFGHTLMRTEFNPVDEQFVATSSPALVLEDLFFKSNIYLLNEQSFMRGTMVDASEQFDHIITHNLVNSLYQTETGNGFDLPAFNIQRGREHGLATYNAFRTHYGLVAATEFSTSTSPSNPGFVDMPQEAVTLLDSVYDHPDDVDLWTGGVSETAITGAALGPLFANMMGRQFRELRQGDRFWYERGAGPGAFPADQIAEIRKVTYSRVLCNSLDFTTIQPEAFKLQTVTGNEAVDCSTIYEFDLSKWATP